MNYRGKLVWLILIGLLLWILFSQGRIYAAASQTVLYLSGPVWRLRTAISEQLARGFKFLSSQRSLVAENLTLREELDKLRNLALDYERLAGNERTWREIFQRTEDFINDGTTVTVGRLLTRPGQSPSGIVIVDLGRGKTRQPVEVGDLVVTSAAAPARGLAWGEIIGVTSRTAKIQLYSAAGYRLNAFLGSDRLPIEVIGRGNGNFRSWLPRDLPVAVGDLITILVEQREYSLGTVQVINYQPVEPRQEILFRTPVNFSTSSWLEVHSLNK